jgi:hypothetical protein
VRSPGLTAGDLKTHNQEADALIKRISHSSVPKLFTPVVTIAYHTNALAHATQFVFPQSEPVWRIPRIWTQKTGRCCSKPSILNRNTDRMREFLDIWQTAGEYDVKPL